MEDSMQMQEINSLLQDKNVIELLDLLKKYKETNMAQGVYDTVNYVQNLENTLSTMMEQMTNMQQELISMREQNNELMAAVNHTVKDTIVENIQKLEVKIQALHVKLDDIRQQISDKAKDIVASAKQYGKLAFIKMTDFLHVREGLDVIAKKANEAKENLESIKVDVEKVKTDKEQKQTNPVEPLGSYQDEMQKFMAARVAEGVQYKTNAEAFEDFKQYYDKRLKMAGAAGKKVEPQKVVEEGLRR